MAFCAKALAFAHGQPMDAAWRAGWLHDCAKCLPDAKKIRLCQEQGVEIRPVERANPYLLHAKAGAVLAQSLYGEQDAGVLDAIRSHTTGRPGMSALEKIVYIADYIEPGRRPTPAMDGIRSLAFRDLDACMWAILEESLAHLSAQGREIDPLSREAYAEYGAGLQKGGEYGKA